MCGFHEALHAEQISIPKAEHPRQRLGKISSESEPKIGIQ
jgi:hypothetical protein